jgi:hypothetical protein
MNVLKYYKLKKTYNICHNGLPYFSWYKIQKITQWWQNIPNILNTYNTYICTYDTPKAFIPNFTKIGKEINHLTTLSATSRHHYLHVYSCGYWFWKIWAKMKEKICCVCNS